MPLELRPATAADAVRAVEIEHVAYGSSPFSPILFPGPHPADAAQLRAAELSEQLRTDLTTRWAKVIDTDLPDGSPQQMVAFAKWHIYTEKPTPTPRTFGAGCNVEACEMLFGGIAASQERILGQRPYVCK